LRTFKKDKNLKKEGEILVKNKNFWDFDLAESRVILFFNFICS